MKKSQKLLSLILSILIIFCGCSAQKEVTSLELPGGPAAPQESLDLNAVPSAPTVEIDTTQKRQTMKLTTWSGKGFRFQNRFCR